MKKVSIKTLQQAAKITVLKKDEAKKVKGGFIVVDDFAGF
jgi:hypothetical protein